MLYYLIKDTGGGKKKKKILLLFPGGGKVPIAQGECGLQGEDMGSVTVLPLMLMDMNLNKSLLLSGHKLFFFFLILYNEDRNSN